MKINLFTPIQFAIFDTLTQILNPREITEDIWQHEPTKNRIIDEKDQSGVLRIKVRHVQNASCCVTQRVSPRTVTKDGSSRPSSDFLAKKLALVADIRHNDSYGWATTTEWATHPTQPSPTNDTASQVQDTTPPRRTRRQRRRRRSSTSGQGFHPETSHATSRATP
jgi:hypothetical protein